MLLLVHISGADSYSSAIDMELSDNAAAPLQLWLAALGAAAHLAQPQQANQDVLLRVLICQESFPATIGTVVPSHKLSLLWFHLDISTANIKQIPLNSPGLHLALQCI